MMVNAVIHAVSVGDGEAALGCEDGGKLRIVGGVEGGGQGVMKAVVEELGYERVPKEYGGGCECEGGCVPRLEHGKGDGEEVMGYEREEEDGGERWKKGGEVVLAVGAGKVGEGLATVQVGEGEEARV